MNANSIKILLVENTVAEACLLQDMLVGGVSVPFEIKHVEQLDHAIKYLDAEHFDVILLALSLPSALSIEPFVWIHTQAPTVPIIVLADTDDETLAVKLVQMGAQDYLVKGQINSQLLVRAIRYAIERNRLQEELEQSRRQEQHDREFHLLEQLARASQASVTARLFGVTSLRESLPDIFDELVRRYEKLLDLALERQTYKVEHNTSEDLRSVAEQLGFLKASPRDVVKIHSSALKKKIDRVTSQRAQAYVEEGRLMVLELMGYLVSYYRNYALGIRPGASDTRKDKRKEG